MRSGKKIAPPVSNKPRFNFIEVKNITKSFVGFFQMLEIVFCLFCLQETFVSAGGVKTKVWTLPAAEMHFVMNDSDSDSDGEPYPNL